MSKTLDKYSIIEIISNYYKDLASEINKMNIYKIEDLKTKNAYKVSMDPLTNAFNNINKYFNDEFIKNYKFKQEINICH